MANFVRVQEIEHEIGEAGRFSLRVTSSDVELRAIEGSTARVRIEFDLRASSEAEADQLLDSVRFQVRRSEGLLEVAEPKQVHTGIGSIAQLLGIGNAKVAARITAEIPETAAVTYTGVSADVLGIGLHGRQEYTTVSGDLVLSDLAGSVRVSGVSGDVSLRAEAPIELRANTVSGDLSAFAPRIGATTITTVSGDVELEGELSHGSPHRIETVSGDLSLGAVGGMTLEVRGLSTDVDVNVAHRSEGSRDRRRYIIGDGDANVLFSSMSGDVTVGHARRFTAGAFDTPAPPAPPPAPEPPMAPDEQLEILRALERGEIDVEEATRRLGGGATDG